MSLENMSDVDKLTNKGLPVLVEERCKEEYAEMLAKNVQKIA